MPNPITIYHNPACGTSRTVLAMIRAAGVEPVVIEYLKNPPDRATLLQLIDEMGITPRQLLRDKGPLFSELGLEDARWTDTELIDHMLAHPVLINRPIVRTSVGTRLCRPADTAQALLDAAIR